MPIALPTGKKPATSFAGLPGGEQLKAVYSVPQIIGTQDYSCVFTSQGWEVVSDYTVAQTQVSEYTSVSTSAYTLATITIPANLWKSNNCFEICVDFETPGTNTGADTVMVKLGGQDIHTGFTTAPGKSSGIASVVKRIGTVPRVLNALVGSAVNNNVLALTTPLNAGTTITVVYTPATSGNKITVNNIRVKRV